MAQMALCSCGRGLALALIQLILQVLNPSFVSGFSDMNFDLTLKKHEMVRGNFSRTFLRVGYHKIAEIPAGAFNMSIKETVKSRNYLALQTRNGVSIINGNWVIDRPGIFTAVGTQLIYKRPNEIRSRTGESITAPGPLSEELILYLIYQQPNPSVQYEYSVPSPDTEQNHKPHEGSNVISPGGTTKSPHSKDVANQSDISNNKIDENSHLTQTLTTPAVTTKLQPTYEWVQSGHSECSTTCGAGRRHVLWACVQRDSQATVSSDLCDTALEPAKQQEECNPQPCPAYVMPDSLDIGEWSECSAKCGPGTQQRQLICRQVTQAHANGSETSVTVELEQCDSSERPETKSPCQLKICSQWEIRSEWSPCSVPCGVGQRSREVVCVSNQGEAEPDQECNMNIKPDTVQNCDMGKCARSWFTSQWSQQCTAECGKGNRTRTAVCLMDYVTDLPLGSCEGERPPEVTACDSGPCQNRFQWFTGPWSQCSADCGNGTQTRSIACIVTNNRNMDVVDQAKCNSLPKPITAQACTLEPCGVQWYVSEWSTCSRSCNGGYRVREVHCLTNNMAPSENCDPHVTPNTREECNKQPCLAEIDPQCSDQYHKCMVVVQARLCIYPYYRSVCCASCSRAQKKNSTTIHKNSIRR
ncbi:thrombospondin type-1 domain-containing protein 4-like [Eucyclogobius newberryi]|uniref:thrombospondin type-1 domain-containing protein 4-like n=1 Tax=Eucyclogobius newberryi TaxID=166745 RepID=UPI003B5B0F8D